jgi:hypothetical protein
MIRKTPFIPHTHMYRGAPEEVHRHKRKEEQYIAPDLPLRTPPSHPSIQIRPVENEEFKKDIGIIPPCVRPNMAH